MYGYIFAAGAPCLLPPFLLAFACFPTINSQPSALGARPPCSPLCPLLSHSHHCHALLLTPPAPHLCSTPARLGIKHTVSDRAQASECVCPAALSSDAGDCWFQQESRGSHPSLQSLEGKKESRRLVFVQQLLGEEERQWEGVRDVDLFKCYVAVSNPLRISEQ
eukprot:766786-Hanusia_phi.AAC.2